MEIPVPQNYHKYRVLCRVSTSMNNKAVKYLLRSLITVPNTVLYSYKITPIVIFVCIVLKMVVIFLCPLVRLRQNFRTYHTVPKYPEKLVKIIIQSSQLKTKIGLDTESDEMMGQVGETDQNGR